MLVYVYAIASIMPAVAQTTVFHILNQIYIRELSRCLDDPEKEASLLMPLPCKGIAIIFLNAWLS
jgi:hypothetical protein